METMLLSPTDFIMRLAQHIPNPGKQTARYNGLYSSASRKKLNMARVELGQKEISDKEVLVWQEYLKVIGYNPKCEVCGLSLIHGSEVSPERKNP